jgi:glycerophosphoryl diester phosphodiesterase
MLVEILIFVLVLISLYMLAIMPKIKKNPMHKSFDGWFYAHRGLHDNKSDAPENSMKAFKRAVQANYGIELDVQLTKDQVPVILHDYNLKRACRTDRKVSDTACEELKEYTLFKSDERIPLLKDVLEAVDGKVPLIIELKIPWHAKPTCEAVNAILKDYKGLYCIESFNPFGLMWYKKNRPDIVRGQLSTDFIKEKIEGSKVQYFILKHLLFNFLTKPDFIAYQHEYKRQLSFSICRRIYRTRTAAWTVKSDEELESCRRYFNWFIFDSFLPENKVPMGYKYTNIGKI